MWRHDFTSFSLNVVAALVIFVVGYFLAKLIARGMKKVSQKKIVDQTTVHFLQSFVFYFLLFVTLLIAVGQLGVKIASIATILGAMGLSLALGLKDYLANLVSGIMILFLRPFKIGDEIEVMGQKGIVKGIGLFFTKIATDSKEVYLLNSKLIQGAITKSVK